MFLQFSCYVISGFRREVDGNSALSYYAANNGNSLPTFRKFLTREDWTTTRSVTNQKSAVRTFLSLLVILCIRCNFSATQLRPRTPTDIVKITPYCEERKKPTRCNNYMFIINFCLNMFRASLCPT